MPQDSDWTTRGLDYEPPQIDTSTAHAARVYDYILGGKDNYLPDREAGDHPPARRHPGRPLLRCRGQTLIAAR
jgi:hypothetical protein